jgi:putative phosphoesterase
MKVAVISDIHDNGHNLIEAIKIIKEKGIEEIIALGDFCYPGIIRYFVTTGLKFRCIFGNNDGDKVGLYQMAQSTEGRIHFSRWEFDEYEIETKKIYVQHHNEYAHEIALSGKFDAVLYGHDHQYHNETLQNNCLLFNPGEICGLVTGSTSFGIWDSDTNTAEKVEIPNSIIVSPFPKE